MTAKSKKYFLLLVFFYSHWFECFSAGLVSYNQYLSLEKLQPPLPSVVLAAVCPSLHSLLLPLAQTDEELLLLLPDASPHLLEAALEEIYSGCLTSKSLMILNSYGLMKAVGSRNGQGIEQGQGDRGRGGCKQERKQEWLEVKLEEEEPEEEEEVEKRTAEKEDFKDGYSILDDPGNYNDEDDEDDEEESDWEEERKSKNTNIQRLNFSNSLSPNKGMKKPRGPRGSYKKKNKEDSPLIKEEKKFPCLICREEKTSSFHVSFNSINFHIKHMLVKHGHPAMCPHCDENFLDMTVYKKHIAKNHSPHVCDICGDSFTEKYAMAKHKETIHEGIKRTCPYCGVKISALSSHIKWMHEGKEEQCSKCDYKTKRPGHVEKHYKRMHTEETKSACEVCGQIFKCMKRHLANTACGGLDKERYKCDLCTKDFSRKEKLRDHVKNVHEKISDRHCPYCSYATYKQYNLKLHITKVHMGGAGMEKQACPHCDKETTNLEHHLKIYHAAQPALEQL